MTDQYEAEVGGQRLTPGTIFRLRGERGKIYRFIKLVTNEQGDSWVDCFGGSHNHEKSRAVRLDAIVPESIKTRKTK